MLSPKITGLTATRNGGKLEVRWHASDLDYALSLDAGPGEHTIAVRVEDDYDNQAIEKAVVRQ